jgi:hypothetical protein
LNTGSRLCTFIAGEEGERPQVHEGKREIAAKVGGNF